MPSGACAAAVCETRAIGPVLGPRGAQAGKNGGSSVHVTPEGQRAHGDAGRHDGARDAPAPPAKLCRWRAGAGRTGAYAQRALAGEAVTARHADRCATRSAPGTQRASIARPSAHRAHASQQALREPARGGGRRTLLPSTDMMHAGRVVQGSRRRGREGHGEASVHGEASERLRRSPVSCGRFW